MAGTTSGWLRAGRVGRAHGLDGSFYVLEATAPLLELDRTVLIGERERKIVRRAGTDTRPILRLEGCAVSDGDRRIGVVRRLLALPSCEVLEVAREEDAGDLLVPLVSDAVRHVDLERREIDVDLRFLGEA
ncbi:MAG: hypothetical protein JO179_15315 [Solirubrobacterales bacterium]|nr:hypothetical protein [Solirubrobacterales bacterium]